MSLESIALAALAAYVAPGDSEPYFSATGGPADHAAALERPGRLPAAYVVLEDFDNGDNLAVNGARQSQTESLAVWLAVGNTLDGHGHASVADARAAMAAADGALFGQEFEGYGPLIKAGGRLIGYDRGTLWRVAYYQATTYTARTP